MWKQWTLFALGFVVIFSPLLGLSFDAKKVLFFIVGAAIAAIAFLLIRDAHFKALQMPHTVEPKNSAPDVASEA